MDNIAWFVPEFLNFSETFIYEPLTKLQGFKQFVFTGKRKNPDKLPYNPVFSSSQDIPKYKARINNLASIIGHELYFSKLIKEHKIKLLHAHFGVNGPFALQFKRRFNLPLVVSFYGADLYRHGLNTYYRWQYSKLFKEADLVLACSDLMRNDLIAYGCPENKVERLYLGIDLQKFPKRTKCHEEGKINILMCGRFVEKKGYEYALRALAKIDFDKYNFSVIGDGPLKEKIQQLTIELGLSDKVNFLGGLTYPEYIKQLYQADILLVPSVTAKDGDSEGCMNMVIMEGLAAGAIVIANRHSAFPEVIKDGITGYLAEEKNYLDLANKLKFAIDHQEVWTTLRENGRKTVEKLFNIDIQSEHLAEKYRKLIEFYFSAT